ncbi:Tigger transposable element-derived protein 6 [Dictyocoela muelleri]|nr:Tigger transposable element-derived protein 6 [Dictyocoela muelleri]
MKKKILSIEKKNEIANFIRQNDYKIGRKRLFKEFNITENQARYILANLEKILNNEHLNSKNKIYIKKNGLEIKNYFKKEVIQAIKMIRLKGGSISFNNLKTIAEKIKNNDNLYSEIKITDYFIRNFIKENDLFYKNLHGEIKSADSKNIEMFFKEFLDLKKIYNDKDIFNLDETSLYIRGINNKSYVIGKNDTGSVKQDKTRFTVLLCVNLNGEKMKTLIIGKNTNKNFLKNFNLEDLNICYSYNKSAWLTKKIFMDYLYDLNAMMISENRKILILLDNFSGHLIQNLTNIKLFYFPANTTAILQPLDLGIIANFKNNYKKLLQNYVISILLNNTTKNEDFKCLLKKITLVEIFHWISKSINSISKETILNCWAKSFKNVDLINENDEKNKLIITDNYIKNEFENENNEDDYREMSDNEQFTCYFDVNFNDILDPIKRIQTFLINKNSKHLSRFMDLIDDICRSEIVEKRENSILKFLNKKI